MGKQYLTAESVCAGHPDKVCDYIADSILDACLRLDKRSRVACEVMATKGRIIVAGEITCDKYVNIRSVVREALRDLGYNPWRYLIQVYVHKQSGDIANGVDRALESRNGDTSWYSTLGAGDQGTVYGYATKETGEMLPMPLVLAHNICKRLDESRKDNVIKGLKPDGKAQVTVEYEDGKPVRVESIVVSIQHAPNKDMDLLRSEIISEVLWPVFAKFPFDENTEILVNPSGRFVNGGPAADTGLTGRKLMVDSYGGLASHGGGAFSGKDPTKVDRSGAYMARFVAKNLVWSGLATKCEVAISYAIGKADPEAISVETFGTSKYTSEQLGEIVRKVFNLRPAAIIEQLDLRDAIYARTAAYGHFNHRGFTWEDSMAMFRDIRNEVRNIDHPQDIG